MTLDEAIEYEKESSQHCKRMLEEIYEDNLQNKLLTFEVKQHEQLAEWLQDYKHIKQWKSDIMDSFCKYDVSSFEELIANARNKAIDAFATKICEILEEYQTGFNMVSMANIWHFSRELAEQLKAGVTND